MNAFYIWQACWKRCMISSMKAVWFQYEFSIRCITAWMQHETSIYAALQHGCSMEASNKAKRFVIILSCCNAAWFQQYILKDFENASLVLLHLTLKIHDISEKIFLNWKVWLVCLTSTPKTYTSTPVINGIHNEFKRYPEFNKTKVWGWPIFIRYNMISGKKHQKPSKCCWFAFICTKTAVVTSLLLLLGKFNFFRVKWNEFKSFCAQYISTDLLKNYIYFWRCNQMYRGILNTYAWRHQKTLAPQTTLNEIPHFYFDFLALMVVSYHRRGFVLKRIPFCYRSTVFLCLFDVCENSYSKHTSEHFFMGLYG